MGTDWLAVVVGIVAGVLTTLLGWYVLVKLLVPKLICGRLRCAGGRYKFELWNDGRRNIVDVTVSCTLFSVGWGDRINSVTATVEIPTSQRRIDLMPPLRKAGYAPPGLDRRLEFLRQSRIITLLPEKISETQLAKLKEWQREKVEQGEATLVDLFNWGDDSVLHVAVSGVDSFSGTRIVTTDYVVTQEMVLKADEENRSGAGVRGSAGAVLEEPANGGTRSSAE